MSRTISTGVYGITVILNERVEEVTGAGQISSDLRDREETDIEYLAAVDALESLILAHACAGIDITSPAYLEGIEVAVEAIASRFS